MFAECIKTAVHPGTWAILGIQKSPDGEDRFAHRGTGFAIDESGHILTCWHVTYMDEECTKECDGFVVMQPELGAMLYPAQLVHKEKDRDIALLKIAGGVGTKPVRLFDETVPFGKSCAAFGHPLSVTDATTNSMRIFTRAAAGIVSMPYDTVRFPGCRTVSLYEVDFFTHGGASGGPVFLKTGDVFGIVSGSLMVNDANGQVTRSNLTVAVSIREAIEFLKPLNVKPEIRWGPKG